MGATMSATGRARQPPVDTIGGASGGFLHIICGPALHLHAREIGMITDDSHFGKVQGFIRESQIWCRPQRARQAD
jgi:hypothetical protein